MYVLASESELPETLRHMAACPDNDAAEGSAFAVRHRQDRRAQQNISRAQQRAGVNVVALQIGYAAAHFNRGVVPETICRIQDENAARLYENVTARVPLSSDERHGSMVFDDQAATIPDVFRNLDTASPLAVTLKREFDLDGCG